MSRKPNSSCFVCGKRIYRRPTQLKSGKVYCSSVCHGIDQRVTKQCPVCGKTYWGAKRTCSRTCANKGRMGIRYLGENKRNNYVQGWLLKEKLAAQRGGVCETCGHDNYNILQVHHRVPKAEGGTDALSNLMLLCPNCHREIHFGYGHYGGSSR